MTFREGAQAALSGLGQLQDALRASVDEADAGRRRAEADFVDHDAVTELASRLRQLSLDRLPELLVQFSDSVAAAGGEVFFARDADEAASHVASLAERYGVRTVAKTKSMVTEEIKLVPRLENLGIDVFETDLGEWVQQLAGEPPAHIVGPALHRSLDDWASVLREHSGFEGEATAEAMAAHGHQVLRDRMLNAAMGITGVNFAVAESGTLLVCTNEGNGPMCTGRPAVHVAVMGMERVVADWEEADVLLALLARHSGGSPVTAYVNAITGPRRADDVDGPDRLHVVIVDNGRSALLGSASEQALKCIRCGACLNACPVFRQVGGHAYGSVYSGPIGAVISPFLVGGDSRHLPLASTLCGACSDVCPVGIPIDDLLLIGRRDIESAWNEDLVWNLWAGLWSNPLAFRATGSGARWRVPSSLVPPPFRNWAIGRELPTRHGKSFRARWANGEVFRGES